MSAVPACARADLHLGKLREVGIAQDQTDLGMGDQPALRVDDVGAAAAADPDLIDDIPDVREVDLGHADAGIAARRPPSPAS